MAGQKFTYVNLTNLFLLSGVKGVEARHNDVKAIPRATFEKAIGHLTAQGAEAKAKTLTNAMERLAPPAAPGPGKGRRAPEVGDTRDYSTQQTGSGTFVRIPVEMLGAEKGDCVRAVFQDGEIKLILATEDEETTGDSEGEAAQASA